MTRLALRLRGGLRARILLALVLTSAVTLLVAAATLFQPLQARLREQSASALRSTALASRPELERAYRDDDQRFGAESRDALAALATRTGASVIATNGLPQVEFGAVERGDRLDDVLQVLTTGLSASRDEGDTLRFAMPLNNIDAPAGVRGGEPYAVVALRRADTDVADVVGEVRNAFLTAGLVGLVVALILGSIISSRLARRLRRLRAAALRITDEGMDAPPPRDERADEVGDLARAIGRMQVELRRQEAARRQFVATASHELRTPLTSLSGNLELLGDDLADGRLDPEDARAQVAAAQVEVLRMRSLATELLELSRLDAGVELRSEPVELAEIARAVAAEFRMQARQRFVEVDVVPPRGPCWARADPDAVARVVRILLDNALRYAPEDSVVRVTPAYSGRHAVIGVADEGPGVPAEEAEQIFERFKRGRATSSVGGFGLGLAIGRELAERLGGSLRLDAPRGRGARFVLSLPIEVPPGGHGLDAAEGAVGAAGRVDRLAPRSR